MVERAEINVSGRPFDYINRWWWSHRVRCCDSAVYRWASISPSSFSFDPKWSNSSKTKKLGNIFLFLSFLFTMRYRPALFALVYLYTVYRERAPTHTSRLYSQWCLPIKIKNKKDLMSADGARKPKSSSRYLMMRVIYYDNSTVTTGELQTSRGRK